MPQISVIIPTKNRQQFIGRAIKSVLAQTYQDFEILVVDDGSTDQTQEVLKTFPDPRILFIRHEHSRGGAAARNTGIAASGGRYIAFLDDDDEWLPEKLARQVSVIASGGHSLGGVCTGHVKVDEESGKIIEEWIPTQRGNLSKEIFYKNCLSTTSSLIFKKEVFEKVGLFDEALKSFQDYDMWVRIAQHFSFDYIQEPLVKYYWHSIQIWNDLNALSKGVERILLKHGGHRGVRKRMAGRYLYIGIRFCSEGNFGEGRKSFFKGIKVYPMNVEIYFRLLLSMFFPPTMKGLKEWWKLS